jgi:thioredoxin 1
MQRPSKALLTLVSAVLLVGAFVYVEANFINPAPKQADHDPAWNTDLDAALAASKKSGKPVLVDFDATWCGPCQQYKKDVYKTVQFMNTSNQYELVEIDIDQQQSLARQYGVSAIPDLRILNSKGNQINRVVGYEGMHLIDDMQASLAQARAK